MLEKLTKKGAFGPILNDDYFKYSYFNESFARYILSPFVVSVLIGMLYVALPNVIIDL